MNTLTSTRKTSVAFAYILLGLVVFLLPEKSISINIAKLFAWIFILVGSIKLAMTLDGKGRIGAMCFIALSLYSAYEPLSRFMWLSDLSNGAFLEDHMESLIPTAGLSKLFSFLDGDLDDFSVDPMSWFSTFSNKTLGFFPTHTFIKMLLVIGGLICWLLYLPFQKNKKAVTLLLSASVVALVFFMLFSLIGMVGLVSPTYNIYMLFLVIGFFSIISQFTGKDASPTKSVLQLCIGFMLTMSVFLDNGGVVAFCVIVGAIICIIGASGIKVFDGKGTGAVTVYSVLCIIFSLFMLIPIIGGIISTIIQFVAYIILCVAFFRFGGSRAFDPGKFNGMTVFGVVMLLNCILAFFPTASGVTAFVLCAIEIPIFIGMGTHAVSASLRPEYLVQSEPDVAEAASAVKATVTEQAIAVAPVMSKPVETKEEVSPYAPKPKEEQVEPSTPQAAGHERYMPPLASEPEKGHVVEPLAPQPPVEVPQSVEVSRPIEAPQPVIQTVQPEQKGAGESPISMKMIIAGVALLLLVVGVLLYSQLYLPYKKDKEAPRYYTFSNITNLRSSTVTGTDYNIVEKLPYGSELITYNTVNDWTYVKINDKKGYVSSYFIVTKADFLLLNSIFGDNESRECIETAKCKLALLNYYKRNKIYGKPSTEVPTAYGSHESGWQVFAKHPSIKPNSVFFPRLRDKNSKFTDFAVIIQNIHTQKRKLLLFTFNDQTEEASLFYEEDAPPTGYIQNMIMSKSREGYTTVKVTYK